MAEPSLQPAPGSDYDFEVAQRAVERGMLRVEEVEAAIVRREREPGRGLLELLPLAPEQVRELKGLHPRPVPAEAAAALRDPANRVGRYWKASRISEGGMGEVWRGWDAQLSRWVALKFPKRDDERARAYFAREAALAASLDHPGIAKVFAVGEWDGAPFLAMQFIEGRTLDRAARNASREQSARWARDVAQAVEAAHRAGVMHRDLKPTNVMVDGAGRAIVLDFGLAKETDVGGQTLGLTQFVAGTPNYMAPEAARGAADKQSDVYGVGAILYELLTGRPPFVGASATEVMVQVLEREPVWPRKLAPGVARDLEAIVLKCLEKEPRRRYATAAQVAEDLEAFLEREPLRHARRPTLAYVLAKRMRRQPLAWSLGATAGALAVTLLALWVVWLTRTGTMRVKVTPPGARVWCGPHSWTAGKEARELTMAPGAWEVRAEAPGYERGARVHTVQGYAVDDVMLPLVREKGRIEVVAAPGDAVIEIAGTSYGSKVVAEIETGSYEVLAHGPGCYERRRTVDVRRGETARTSFGLDRGELWRYVSASLHSSTPVAELPDLDGDGAFDVMTAELADIVLLSGADGSARERFRISDDPNWSMLELDLGGAVGKVVAAAGWIEKRLVLTVIDLRAEAPRRVLCRWVAEAGGVHPTGAAFFTTAPDLGGDGVREILVGGAADDCHAVDVVAGLRVARFEVGEPGKSFFGLSHPDPRDDGLVAFAISGRESDVVQGAMRIPEGRVLWKRAGALSWTTVDVDGDGVREMTFLGDGSIEALSVRTGEVVQKWTGEVGEGLLCGDFDADGRTDIVTRLGDRAVALGGNGTRLWEARREGLTGLGGGPAGEVVAYLGDRFERLDVRTGRTLWSTPGRVHDVRFFDVDRDGRREVLVGVDQVGIRCLDASGVELWTLRSTGAARPLLLAGPPGEPRLVYGRGSTFVAMARLPRVLWHVASSGPLLAGPVVASAGLDRAVVVQCGDWDGAESLRAFDAATGTRAWSLGDFIPPNRPPAIGPGLVLAYAQKRFAEEQGFWWIDARDGRVLERRIVALLSDHYATPLLADLDGDGAPDALQIRRSARDVVAMRRDGKLLWKRDLPGAPWGGAAAFELEGGVGVAVPVQDAPLRAFRGKDGADLWEAEVGGSMSIPVPADVTGDTGLDILVAALDGTLRVLDAKTGRELARRACGDSKTGSPAAAELDGAPLVVAPAGTLGLAAFAGRALEPLWKAAVAVEGTPLVADLDGDGALEVSAGTLDGRLAVLDARTGRVLWNEKLASSVSAPVAAADLDGDGVLDLLVADRDGRLTAVSGRSTRAARAK